MPISYWGHGDIYTTMQTEDAVQTSQPTHSTHTPRYRASLIAPLPLERRRAGGCGGQSQAGCGSACPGSQPAGVRLRWVCRRPRDIVRGCWDIWTLGRWDIGISGHQDIETSGHRDFETSGHRDIGTSGHCPQTIVQPHLAILHYLLYTSYSIYPGWVCTAPRGPGRR